VGLRVEEDLGVADLVGPAPLQIGPGHVVEILRLEQHLRAGVVDIEKGLQVTEVVGRAHLIH